nr:hypothetical protein BaRGS_004164 [Batillaria attramentaria]
MAAKDFNPNDKGLYFILEPEAGRQDVTETSFTTFGPQATAGQIVRHSDLYRDDRCNYYSEIKDEEVGDHVDDGGEKAAGATGASPFRWRSPNKKSKRPCSVGDYDEVTFDDDDDEDDTFADLGTPAPLTVASLPNMALALGGSKVSKTSNKMDDNLVVEEDEELYENTGSLMMSQTSHDERKTDRETDAKAPTNEDNDTDAHDDDDDDGLEMVDNVVYESSANVGKDSAKGSSQVAKHNPTHDHEEDEIEMIDNELYESSGNVITDSTADTRGSTGSVTTEGDYDEMVMTDNIVYESSETMTRDEVKGSNKPHTASVVDEDDYDVVHIPDDVEDGSSDKRQNGKAGNQDSDSDDELVMVDNEIYESSSALDLVPQWT